MPVRPRIEVEGAKDVRKQIRAFDRRVGDLKAAHRAASEVVAKQARIDVPTRSGKLKRTVRPTASQVGGFVSAGWGARVRYAGVIHFGNPRKKGRLGVIRPQPFIYEAADRRQYDVVQAYEDHVNKAIQNAGL